MSNKVDHWETVAMVHNPERLEWWREVFDGDTCPIVSIIPNWGNFTGIGTRRFYSLDLKAISAEQKHRLVKSIADKFSLMVDEVAADIDRVGVPILAADVVVSSSDFRHIAGIVLESLM